MKIQRLFPFVSILVLISGCSTLCPTDAPIVRDRPETCRLFLENLDEAVQAAGVIDESTASVPCFPYLRTDRFLAIMKKDLDGDKERDYWLKWMLDLNLSSRKKEVQNLPDEAVLSLNGGSVEELGSEGLLRRMESCSCQMLERDQAHPEYFETLRSVIHVPDEYSFWMRAGGLYPLAWFAFNGVTNNVRNRFKAWYEQDLEDLPIRGNLRAFVPDEPAIVRASALGQIIKASQDNPWGFPGRMQCRKKGWSSPLPLFLFRMWPAPMTTLAGLCGMGIA